MNLVNNPAVLAQIESLLSDGDVRVDAGEVAFVAKDLQFVFAQTYDVEYPELKATQLIPIDDSVDPGADSYTYGQWNFVGKAMFISDYAKDFPMVDANLTMLVFPTAGIGIGYQYSVQDLRKSAMRRLSKGQSLDQVRATTARRAHEQFIDDVAAFGDTKRGLKGFVNHPDVPTFVLPNGSWNTLTTGSDAENTKIALDLTALAMASEIATLGLYISDTLLLPLSMKQRLKGPTSTYIKQPLIDNWLLNQENITSVVWWNRLDAAFTNGAYVANEALAIAYKKSPEVLKYVIPLPFTQHAPQQVLLTWMIPCESRTGGVCMIRPLAVQRANTHS